MSAEEVVDGPVGALLGAAKVSIHSFIHSFIQCVEDKQPITSTYI